MILFLVCLAVLNLGLGFAAALYTGRGPRCWSDVSNAIHFKVVLDLSRWTARLPSLNPLALLRHKKTG